MKMAVFWDEAPCNLEDSELRFRDAYCFYHGDEYGAHKKFVVDGVHWTRQSQKTAIFMLYGITHVSATIQFYKVIIIYV